LSLQKKKQILYDYHLMTITSMTTTSTRPIVLILANDPAFSHEVIGQWPQDPAPNSDGPEFVVLDEGLSLGLHGSDYDLAIADASFVEKSGDSKSNRRKPLNKRLNKNLKQSLHAAGKPAIIMHCDPSRDIYNIQGAILELRREPGIWPAFAGLVGREILRRRQAESRACEAERIRATGEAEAMLGRYMVEMRTNVNNALTTLLGNAELLVHESGLPACVHAQADTIRNMALRLHEIFQRFSSIEKELNVTALESGKKAASAAAGKV
jgi:hypothetical protein